MAIEYRASSLSFRDRSRNRLKSACSSQFRVHQALPRFMVDWAEAALPKYGPERIITSTVNACNRCVIGNNALCGEFCFAHAENSGSQVLYADVPQRYAEEHQRLSAAGQGAAIFLSTDTEPLPGNRCDISHGITVITRQLLRQMVECPPDGLILHTHTDVSASDAVLHILKDVSQATNLIVGIGFETDTDDLPECLPAPHTSIKARLDAIERLAAAGIKTQAAVAPLVGFRDFEDFAKVFPKIGAHRIMVGDLRLDFAIGGTAKAAHLKSKLGLPAPSQEDAKALFEDLGYPPERVGYRDEYYVVLPEAA